MREHARAARVDRGRTALLAGGAAALILMGGLSRGHAGPVLGEPPPRPAIESGRVIPGDEVFCRTPPEALRNLRLGLVINQTSLLPDGTPLLQSLLEQELKIGAVFTPEHGFRGGVEAGKAVAGEILREIPVISLYGRTRRPLPEHLRLIDAFVYDIQDVGTRFYTYISTLKYVMEGAAGAGLPVYVLDRPNPLGGVVVEGPILQPAWESFIGTLPIPVRYGLTVGELAQMMRGEGWVPNEVELHVVPLRNWRRSRLWAETGLPWIPTSPNIPTPDTALIFPGTGLLGGIILNQGLGTPHPFLMIGAPWMDPAEVAAALSADALSGLRLEASEYIPRVIPGKTSEPPYADRACRGFLIRFTDRAAARPLRFTLELIRVLVRLYPERIYTESRFLTQMYGTEDLELFLKGETGFETLINHNREDRRRFLESRRPYLLYQ